MLITGLPLHAWPYIRGLTSRALSSQWFSHVQCKGYLALFTFLYLVYSQKSQVVFHMAYGHSWHMSLANRRWLTDSRYNIDRETVKATQITGTFFLALILSTTKLQCSSRQALEVILHEMQLHSHLSDHKQPWCTNCTVVRYIISGQSFKLGDSRDSCKSLQRS